MMQNDEKATVQEQNQFNDEKAIRLAWNDETKTIGIFQNYMYGKQFKS